MQTDQRAENRKHRRKHNGKSQHPAFIQCNQKQIAKDQSENNQKGGQSGGFHFLQAQPGPGNLIIFGQNFAGNLGNFGNGAAGADSGFGLSGYGGIGILIVTINNFRRNACLYRGKTLQPD